MTDRDKGPLPGGWVGGSAPSGAGGDMQLQPDNGLPWQQRRLASPLNGEAAGR
jgi:hypothetical protein